MQYPGRTIKSGESSKAVVREVQVRLVAVHCGPVDASGVFGPKTAAAVKLFQARHTDGEGRPLKVDGKAGPLTWAALFGTTTVPEQTSATSDFLAAVLATAASQVGVREQPRNSNSGPEVDAYLKRVGVPLSLPPTRKPWCCAFVYWCFDETARQRGRANPMVRTAGCLDHWNRAAARGARLVTAGRAASNPSLIAPGTVFILDAGRGLGHTGLVERVESGFVHTLEGNTDPSQSREGGGVYRLTRKIANINKGFIDYAGV
jgi:hypothetical protein